MLFESQRLGRRAAYAPPPTATVAALAYLREETFPGFVEPPQFIPRGRLLPEQTEWFARLFRWMARYAGIAAVIAALAVIAVTAVPALAALREASEAPPLRLVESSAGTTGALTEGIGGLSAATFMGNIPVLQEERYLTAAAGTAPVPVRFVQGAREADLAGYIQEVGTQLTLPYLNDAVYTQNRIGAWIAAVEEAERQAAERRAAASAAAAAASRRTVWQASLAVAGTRIPGARVTFYACLGDGFCGNMSSGQPVFAGAAACSSNLPFGTRFVIASDPTQRVFTCLDRGALASTWVDVWFYDAADGYAWQSMVGTRSDIIIVE